LTASAVVLLGFLTLAPLASARPRVIIRGGFGGGWGYPGWYDPYWGWGPGYYPGPESYMGDVKIKNSTPGESIYVDGGFVGVTDKVKKIPLAPGTHSLELRASDGNILFQENVHVTAGRTVDIHL
jgi:hypothetical protein